MIRMPEEHAKAKSGSVGRVSKNEAWTAGMVSESDAWDRRMFTGKQGLECRKGE